MLGEIRGEVRFKEPLAFHTSLRCGGPADIFIIPQDVDDVRKTLMFADKEKLPVAILGSGHNTLVRDRGFRGIVLRIEGCLGRMEFHGEEVTIGCGAGLSTMIREAAALGLGGIECLVGIPATVGGALAMNAGTHDGAIWDFVSAVYFLHAGRDDRRAEAGARVHASHLLAPDRGDPPRRAPAAPPQAAEGDPRRDSRTPQAEEGHAAAGIGGGGLRLEERRTTTMRRACSRRPASGASAWAAPRSPRSTRTSSSIVAGPPRRTSSISWSSPSSACTPRRACGSRPRSGSWAIEFGHAMSAIPTSRALSGPRARPAPSTDLASRARLIANQRHRARHGAHPLRRALQVLAVGLTVAGLAVAAQVAADWIQRTPLLATRSVEIAGARRLDEGVVRAAAGIEPGTNLLAVDVAAAEARVAGLPGVRRAHVARHLPARVTVLVEEREPYALVNAHGLHWIDAEGYLVTSDVRPGSTGLPILTGADAPAPGSTAPSESLRAGLALLHVLERTSGRLAPRVSEVDLGRPNGPMLYLVDGIEVRLGPDAWEDRLARLEGVLAELDARAERVASIDLRFRDQVVLTPRILTTSTDPGRASVVAGRRRPSGEPATLGTPAPAGLERR